MLKALNWNTHESRVLYVVADNPMTRGYISAPPLQNMVRLRMWDGTKVYVSKPKADDAFEKAIKN